MNCNSTYILSTQSEDTASFTLPVEDSAEAFPTISRLPPELITSLIERHSARLSSPYTGKFDAEKVVVKIGKETTSWRLLGM